MSRITCQSLLGAGLAALLTLAPAMAALAQDATPPADKTAPKPVKPASAATAAAKPVKPEVKTAAKKPDPAHPARKVAAQPAKSKPEEKKLAATPKKPAEPHKTAAAEKKPVETQKTAAAPAKTQTASYTITTTGDSVTDRTIRTVAIPETRPPAQAAALPATPPQPASRPTPAAASAAAMATTPPLVVTAPAPQPAASGPAAAFVANFLGEAFRIARASGVTALQRRAQLADLFTTKMDAGGMAVSTTANELKSTPADFQRRFRTILISYLVETYYPRIELASDTAVKVDTVAATPLPDGTQVVWTTFKKDGWPPQSVKWQLAATPDGYRIVDIFSAGASLVQMERDTFVSVMRDGGLPELMAKLDARTKALASAAAN